MPTLVRFSLAEYDRMIAREVFDPRRDQRMELIRGEIREMTPPGPTHEEVIDVLNRWSFENLDQNQVRVRVQNSIGLPDSESAPQPDVAWVKAKSYREERPAAEDVLLLIEVSDSSLLYDQSEKARIYAEAGIPEYWIVNIPQFCVESYREPAGETYQTIVRYDMTDCLSPSAFPGVKLLVRDLFQP